MLSACRGKLWDKKPHAPLGPLQVIFYASFGCCPVLCSLTTSAAGTFSLLA